MNTPQGTKKDEGKPLWGLFPFDLLPTDRDEVAGLIHCVQNWARRKPIRTSESGYGITFSDMQCMMRSYYPVDGPRRSAMWDQVVKVLEFGAKKYAPYNWESGIAYSRVYHAFCRHWKAILIDGQELDDETGLKHEAHALCELMFLASFEARGLVEFDDRPKPAEPDRKCVVRSEPGSALQQLREAAKFQEDESNRLYLWAHGGRKLYLEPRTPEEIPDVQTIAVSLDGQTRWTGHAGRKWSTAAHAVAVAILVDVCLDGHIATPDSRNKVRSALHHDDHECLSGEMNSNLKKFLRRNGCTLVDDLQRDFDRLIAVKLGLRYLHSEIVDRADKAIGQAEAEILPIQVPRELTQQFCKTDLALIEKARIVVQDVWAQVLAGTNMAQKFQELDRHLRD